MNNQQTPEFDELKREATRQETDKKCPQCGGVTDFDPESGGLLCPYCGHIRQIQLEDDAEKTATELDFASAQSHENCDWGERKKTVICKSCGAESVYDELELSNECPYCGSNQVMEEKGASGLAPGGVCVFKVDAKGAGASFAKWIKRRLFCPSAAKKMAKPESFKGVYVPSWTFDCETCSAYTGQYGISRTVRDAKGNTRTTIDWYACSGTHRQFINDHLVLATSRYNTSIFGKLQPYNTEDNLVYKPEYIAGFISERYSVGLGDSWEKAKKAISLLLKNSVTNRIGNEHGTSHVRDVYIRTTYSDIKYKYLLLPVWISSFSYKGKVYQFMVNGQTGKTAGKTPVSAVRVLIAVLIALGLVGAVLYYLNSGSGYDISF